MVTAVPPVVDPLFGERLLTVGGTGVLKATICAIHDPESPSGALAL
jgi:hypothetical protein